MRAVRKEFHLQGFGFCYSLAEHVKEGFATGLRGSRILLQGVGSIHIVALWTGTAGSVDAAIVDRR